MSDPLLTDLDDESRARVAAPEDRAALEAMVREARAAWPQLGTTDARFAAYLVTRAPDGPLAQGLASLRGSDLLLACACAAGDARAIAVLDAQYLIDVDAAFGRVRPRCGLDEAKQVIRERLLVAEPGTLPRIALYSGRGDLRAWLRVMITRTLLNLATRAPREEDLTESLMQDAAAAQDIEHEHLRARYTAELRASFAEAAASLAPRERTLLRYAVCEGLTVEAIGALYGVHRATAARWVAGARAALEEGTRAALRKRLGDGDLGGVLGLVQSRIDLSMSRHLAPGGD